MKTVETSWTLLTSKVNSGISVGLDMAAEEARHAPERYYNAVYLAPPKLDRVIEFRSEKRDFRVDLLQSSSAIYQQILDELRKR